MEGEKFNNFFIKLIVDISPTKHSFGSAMSFVVYLDISLVSWKIVIVEFMTCKGDIVRGTLYGTPRKVASPDQPIEVSVNMTIWFGVVLNRLVHVKSIIPLFWITMRQMVDVS